MVAHGLAHRCEIQVAYGIGIAQPISIYIDCFGTNLVSYDIIRHFIEEKFDFIVSNPPYIETKTIQTLDKEVQMERAYWRPR